MGNGETQITRRSPLAVLVLPSIKACILRLTDTPAQVKPASRRHQRSQRGPPTLQRLHGLTLRKTGAVASSVPTRSSSQVSSAKGATPAESDAHW